MIGSKKGRSAYFRCFWVITLLCVAETPGINGTLRRCVSCRSRGELGSCKDPFNMNATQIENEKGVETVPCASGWCMKIIESRNLNNEYGIATERSCLQRGPNDGEERCAKSVLGNKKVFLCMCTGDLCNSAPSPMSSMWTIVTLSILGVLLRFIC